MISSVFRERKTEREPGWICGLRVGVGLQRERIVWKALSVGIRCPGIPIRGSWKQVVVVRPKRRMSWGVGRVPARGSSLIVFRRCFGPNLRHLTKLNVSGSNSSSVYDPMRFKTVLIELSWS